MKHKLKALMLAMLSVFFVLGAKTTHADTIKIVSDTAYAPFEFKDSDQTYKGNTIIIDLSAIILTEEIQVVTISLERSTMIWLLRYDENTKEVFMDLLIDIDEGYTFSIKLDIQELIKECIDCVKENKLLDNCEMINSTISKLFNMAFKSLINDRHLIYSNRILNGNVIVKHANKILGYASRFIINKNNFSILEYVGKRIDSNNVSIEIYYDKFQIGILTTENISDEMYNNTTNQLKYYSFKGMEIISPLPDEKAQEYVKNPYNLNVCSVLKKPESMYQYILNNNTAEDITKYKISMKPAIKLVNINDFMIREFNR